MRALSRPRPTRQDTDDMVVGVWENGVGDEDVVLELLAGSNYSRGQVRRTLNRQMTACCSPLALDSAPLFVVAAAPIV